MMYEKLFTYYLGLLAAVICVLPKLIVPGILGLLIFVIAGYVKKRLAYQWSWPGIALAALYLAYLAGALFTQHPQHAGHYIESKLSFLVFPVLLSFRFRNGIDFRPVAIGLALGIVVTSVFGFANAWATYQATGYLKESFTTGNFSNIHHPSYFCMYILTAMALLWYGYAERWRGFSLKWILPVSAYFLFIYALCLSLAGMLMLFALACVVVLRFIFRKYGKKGFAAALIVFPALASGLFLASPQMKLQLSDASRYFLEYTDDPQEFVRERPGYKEGNEVRLIMWTVAAEEFGRHPFGVGTGNIDDHLSYNLAKYGQKDMAKKDADGLILYNPHNQYLQTAMEIGIFGLLVLLALIVLSVRFALRNRNTVLLVLIATFAFNALFESVLQRQSGIVFLSFWLCLLIAWSRSNAKNSTGAHT